MSTFEIGQDDFLLDGEPFRVLSGAIHYFRVHPDLWADRIRKAKRMGLNTVETYLAWNLHEPEPGVFDTSGMLDLRRFLELIAAEGMFAIVRPGPYICAEWDNGGLPAWLTAIPDVGIRRFEPRFMAAIERYYRELLPVVAEMQIDRGGPVILVQVENEYGAYGSDTEYLRAVADLTTSHGITVPLTTVDQPTDRMLSDGSLPELHKTASFGSRADERLATLRRHQPTGPLMCSEFWDGWFDHWGTPHHTTSAEDAARELDAILAAGASVNIYMFHGGTNFGFTNGANDKSAPDGADLGDERFEPTVTSYDYDAPLDEAGHPTEKYWAFREVIARYEGVPDAAPARDRVPAPAFVAPVTSTLPLWDVADRLGAYQPHRALPSTDDIGHFSGFSLYRAEIDCRGRAGSPQLSFAEVRDRAIVFLDREPVGVLSRDRRDRSISLPPGARGCLEVLVEDQGRVNYGERLGEPKGLIGPAELDGERLDRWELAPVDLGRIDAVAEALRAAEAQAMPDGAPRHPLAGPVFARATFDGVAPATDLFLDTRHWGKGVAWINGANLGRYWNRGPQHTLHVPGPLVRDGENEVILFELHELTDLAVRFVREPDLGADLT